MTEEFEEGNRKKIALLIDGWVDGFCIVSNDSDYTRLATRIRDERKNNILDYLMPQILHIIFTNTN